MYALATVLAARGDVDFNFSLAGILALAAGIAILAVPRLLNYIVAGYLIIVGLFILFDVKGF